MVYIRKQLTVKPKSLTTLKSSDILTRNLFKLMFIWGYSSVPTLLFLLSVGIPTEHEMRMSGLGERLHGMQCRRLLRSVGTPAEA